MYDKLYCILLCQFVDLLAESAIMNDKISKYIILSKLCNCVQAPPKPAKPLTSSRTLDSLVELQSTKINTPSMSSSGYGSQAVSTTNLTSEDSISIKSISVDETPDLEYRNPIDNKKPEKMDSSLVEETPEEYLGEVNSALDNLDISQSACTEG